MQRLYMMGVVEVKMLVGGSATAEKRHHSAITVLASPSPSCHEQGNDRNTTRGPEGIQP
jgi:hypothetical protein